MWGRGCFCALLLLAAPLHAVEPLEVPSGHPITLTEVLQDEAPGALWLRFRFLAPDIARDGGRISVDAAVRDMQHLCDQIAVSYVADAALDPARIVISLSDRFVPFGQQDPAATQFFELYSLQDGRCIWEEF